MNWDNIEKEKVIKSCTECKQYQCNLECPWWSGYRNLTPDEQKSVNDNAFGRQDGKFNN